MTPVRSLYLEVLNGLSVAADTELANQDDINEFICVEYSPCVDHIDEYINNKQACLAMVQTEGRAVWGDASTISELRMLAAVGQQVVLKKARALLRSRKSKRTV